MTLFSASQAIFNFLSFPSGNQNSKRLSGLKSQIESEEADQENELKFPNS